MHTDSIIVQNRIIQECWNMDRKREKSIFRLFSFNWLEWLVFSLLFSELLSRDFLPFVLIVFANRITHSFDIMSGEFTYFNRIVGFPSNCSQTSFFNHKWVFYLSFQFLLGSFVSLSLCPSLLPHRVELTKITHVKKANGMRWLAICRECPRFCVLSDSSGKILKYRRVRDKLYAAGFI